MNKFLQTLLLILSNQRGELDLGGGDNDVDVDIDVDGGDDDGEDLSNEGLLASINSENEDDDTEKPDEGQPDVDLEKDKTETDPEKPEGKEETELEKQLKAFKGSEETPETGTLLEELNKLGILNKGMPVEFDDLEKAKEMLSKGFDYTQKTQELAGLKETAMAEVTKAREDFTTEREAFNNEVAQNKQALTNYSIFQRAISEIKTKDPELFEEIDSYYRGHEDSHNQASNNPEMIAMKAQMAEMQKTINGNTQTEEQKENSEIQKNWEKEIKTVQTSFGAQLRSLGIKPDWKKVQGVWSADSTGTMTVQKALFAEYGDQMSKAMANKNKLAETRAKVANKMGSTDTTKTEESEVFGMGSGNSYENEAFEILKTL